MEVCKSQLLLGEMDYLVLLLCLCLVWFLHFIVKYGTDRNPAGEKKLPLPPGPRPFPIVGNLLQLGDSPHKSLAKLARSHGPIMTLQLGRVTTVVISSASVAREVFQTHDLALSSRTIPEAVTPCEHGRLSVSWMPVSPLWRALRKIMNSHMLVTSKMESTRDLRQQEVQNLVARVASSARSGEAVVVTEEAFKATLNILSNAIFSMDFADPSSGTGKEFTELINHIMGLAGKPNLADYFPALKWIDPNRLKNKMEVHFGGMLNVLDSLINKRLQTRGDSMNFDAPRSNEDFLDALLHVREDKTGEINMHIVKLLLLDIFVAGTDTTANTSEWAMAELLRNPDKLSKAKAELELAIGKGNLVQEPDIVRLPYLQAIAKETFRLHPAVPLLLPRKAEADTVVGGFTIPKGAQVMVNVWAIGRDPAAWEDPDMFMPERFLGSNIDVKGQHFELIPFGAGRRICPGLPLALRMVQLMLGSLINCFDWRLENGMKPEDVNMEDTLSITLRMNGSATPSCASTSLSSYLSEND